MSSSSEVVGCAKAGCHTGVSLAATPSPAPLQSRRSPTDPDSTLLRRVVAVEGDWFRPVPSSSSVLKMPAVSLNHSTHAVFPPVVQALVLSQQSDSLRAFFLSWLQRSQGS